MHDRYQAFLGFLGMVRTKVGFWRTLSALCLVCLFVLIMVRAGTQSITADEALNYNSFLRDSIGQVFTSHYDANNHVLHTVMIAALSPRIAQRHPAAICGPYRLPW